MHRFVFKSYLDNAGQSPRMVLCAPQRVGSLGAGLKPVGHVAAGPAAAYPKTKAINEKTHKNFIWK